MIPSVNAIVITTGSGFEYDEIDALLGAALVDPNNPLPANPGGVAELEAAVDAVAQPPAPEPVPPLPPVAQEISGKMFELGPNPIGLDALGLEFDGSAEAILHLRFAGSDQAVAWPLGLDGVFRLFPGENGLHQGMRGSWVDDQTFVLEHDEIANNSHATYTMRFEGDRMVVEGRQFAHELGRIFEGKLQNP